MKYDLAGPSENQAKRLKPHPLNYSIYGKAEPDLALLTSVKEHGVLNPIVVNEKKEILSGNRRWRAAILSGIKDVPILTLRARNSINLLSELFLIESNKARVKTKEILGLEFTNLKRIETALAKERQKLLSNKETGSGKFPGTDKGDARDKAAAAVGMSGRTAGKLEHLINEAAKSKKARTLLDRLNEGKKSVDGAYRELKKNPEKISEGALLAKQLTKLFKNGEVSRSKKDGMFHLLLRDLEEKEIRNLAKSL